MTSTATLTWFAGHEIRLARREWLAMMTAGRRWRGRNMAIGLIAFVALMHLPAYAMVGRFAAIQAPLDKPALVVVTASLFLAWALVLSQAIESVTRVFYARADLDLIVSSPVALPTVFSVRLAAIALTVTAMAMLLATPFIDVLVLGGGWRWLSVYGVVVAAGLSASAVAIAVTVMLFRAVGPGRTRLVAQIFAAITGAGFVIGLQVSAILSFGTLSRFALLTSDAAVSLACADVGSVDLVAGARAGWRRQRAGMAARRQPRPAWRDHRNLRTAICRLCQPAPRRKSRQTMASAAFGRFAALHGEKPCG